MEDDQTEESSDGTLARGDDHFGHFGLWLWTCITFRNFFLISRNKRMDTRIGNLTSKAFNVWCYRRKIRSMCVYGVRRLRSTNAKVVEVAFT